MFEDAFKNIPKIIVAFGAISAASGVALAAGIGLLLWKLIDKL